MYNMFTEEGNTKVAALVAQARQYADVDGPQNPTELAWNWCLRELEKLGAAEGFEEATDTAVREAVYDFII